MSSLMPDFDNTNADLHDMTQPDEVLGVILTRDVDPVRGGLALKKLADNDQLTGENLLSLLSDATDQLPDADPAVTGGLLRLIHLRCLQGQAAGDDDA
ncbi:MAG: HEAT repeat domain-containing protein, partial [Rhodopirellula sp. JB053]